MSIKIVRRAQKILPTLARVSAEAALPKWQSFGKVTGKCFLVLEHLAMATLSIGA